MLPEVTICIPAWQSELFIQETLKCACNQSYANIRILISIDKCEDKTEKICRIAAEEDPRIQIFTQNNRLGWSGNVNFLLSQIKSPLFVFYWHDDIIGPEWVETLATALIDYPDALSAYGKTRHFGGYNVLEDNGKSFVGSTTERLFWVLTDPLLFGLTRCMMRNELIGSGLRIPQINGQDYYENNNPYWLHILASGPMLHVPEAVYQRRNGTGESVVDRWLKLPRNNVLEAMKQNVADCMQILRERLTAGHDLELMRICLSLFIMRRVRLYELHSGHGPLIQADELAIESRGLYDEIILSRLDETQRQRIKNAQAGLAFLEGKYWQNKGKWEQALTCFESVIELEPDNIQVINEVDQCFINLNNNQTATHC